MRRNELPDVVERIGEQDRLSERVVVDEINRAELLLGVRLRGLKPSDRIDGVEEIARFAVRLGVESEHLLSETERVCDRTGHCSAGIPLGQPCGLGDLCADAGAFCDTAIDGSPGACALPRPDGAPCTYNAGCDSVYCDPFTLTCARQRVCL
jgi:hypothetical protein